MRKKLESTIKAAVWCIAALSLAGAIWLMFTRNPEAVVFDGAGFGIQLFGSAMVILMLAYFLIQSLLAWSYREAPELSDEELPKCTVIVPAYNEGEYVLTALRSVAACDYPAGKLEIIAVNDGSQDDTWEWMRRAEQEFPGLIVAKNFKRNRGKRHALYEGIRIAHGDIVVTIDSDSEVTRDSLRKIAAPFAKPSVGAVAGSIRVSNLEEGIIPRMLDVAFVFGFEFIRCAQSKIGSVLCTPGALSAYRVSAIRPLLEEWVNQTFLGEPSGIGEDRAITSLLLRERWRVEFQCNAIAWTKMPTHYGPLCKMLLRWTRSDIRENLIMFGVLLRRFEPFNLELPGLQLNLLVMSLSILLPLFSIPFSIIGLVLDPLPFLVWTVFGTMIWSFVPAAIYASRASLRESVWSFVYGIYNLVALSWVCVYSLLTVRNSKWMTRGVSVLTATTVKS